jgi:hypothetical protein
MMPPVTETVIGTVIVSVPSEIVIVVEPLLFEPMPIDVATNVPVEAGVVPVETVTEAGETVTIVVSLLTAVMVPLKPFSLTTICWLPLTPPNAKLAGTAPSVMGVGVGEGLGDAVAVEPGDVEAPGAAVAPAAAVDEVWGAAPPPPPQAARTAKATIP